MDPEESRKLLEDVEDFCKELAPIEDACYLEERYNDQLIPLARKYSLCGMPISKRYGGRGADALTYVKALERIGIEGTGVRTFFSGHTSIGQLPIQRWGNEGQKKKYLTSSSKGEKILAFALTEPDAGSNPLEMKTTYEKVSDGFMLNGVKYLISNADIADAMVTFAYPKGGGRISSFIIDSNSEGISKEPLAAKLGMFTADTGMFELTNFSVPKDNLLGDEGDGFRIAMYTLMGGRLSVAAGCLGVIADCLSEAVRYSKERSQHGKLIGKHQLVQEHIAMIKTELDAAKLLTYEAARLKQLHEENPNDSNMHAQADLMIAEAKFYAANAAWDAADRAVQVFGGRGYSFLYRPGRHLQDVRVARIYEGTDEIMKLKIGSAVLGKEFEAFT